MGLRERKIKGREVSGRDSREGQVCDLVRFKSTRVQCQNSHVGGRQGGTTGKEAVRRAVRGRPDRPAEPLMKTGGGGAPRAAEGAAGGAGLRRRAPERGGVPVPATAEGYGTGNAPWTNFCRDLRFPLSFCRNVRYNEDINDFEGGEPHDKRRGIAALFYRSGYHIVACAVASILLHESCPQNVTKNRPFQRNRRLSVVRPVRFERMAFGVGVQRSIQLSYGREYMI